jgi:plastocyanin
MHKSPLWGVISRAGKKPYHCEIHPHMKGRITVKR